MSFASLGLPEALQAAVAACEYTDATEVQQQAIPLGLQGTDLLVSSRTGSGKTAAFLLPILTQVLARREAEPDRLPAFVPRFQPGPQRGRRGPGRNAAEPFHAQALILAPTRELAQQVAQAAQQLGKGIKFFTVATVVGGMPYPAQLQRLRAGADLIVATPGRLLDVCGQNPALLSEIKTLVLDEADRMLDLGFIEDIEAIAAMLPKPRQTLMFSATFDGRVGGLARELTHEPQRIDVASAPEQKAQIEQRLHWADHPHHRQALLEHLLADTAVDQAVVFAGTQIEAEAMAGQLAELGHAVAALHGGMPQGKRNRTLMGLRRRELRVLVATDVAARGIDVPTISHVINIGLPMKAEDYVHRIGRTGRAGRSGLAVTLAMREDLPRLRRLQAYTKEALAPSRVEGLEPKKPDPVVFSERPRREFDGGADRRSFGGQGRPLREGGQGRFQRDDRSAPRHAEQRPAWGERKPFHGEQRPAWGEQRPAWGERRDTPFAKPAFEKPRFGGHSRPQRNGDRPSYGDRPNFGNRPSFGDRPNHGERPSYAGQGRPFRDGDKPRFDATAPRRGFGQGRPRRDDEGNRGE
ncbi:DEAD/DEAH box helicase [Inhella sp.]|uniref:DEAD/DEAH box helicase n=1 Tax=Inhella sp. TaxID=1921806 RepID=UPI0035AFD7D9